MQPVSEPYRWTGHIRRDGDGITGELTDTVGFVIHLRGEREPGGYRIIGTPGLVPPSFLFPNWMEESLGDAQT